MPRWQSYTSYSLYYDGSDMTDDETEFLRAIADYQKQFDRRYPTWLEILHILRCLGYRKAAEPKSFSKPLPPPNDHEQAEPRTPK